MLGFINRRILNYPKNNININLKKFSYDFKEKEDYNLILSNFITSGINVVVITSLLWGFESYNQKIKTINDTQNKINEIWIHCINEKKELRRVLTKDINKTNQK